MPLQHSKERLRLKTARLFFSTYAILLITVVILPSKLRSFFHRRFQHSLEFIFHVRGHAQKLGDELVHRHCRSADRFPAGLCRHRRKRSLSLNTRVKRDFRAPAARSAGVPAATHRLCRNHSACWCRISAAAAALRSWRSSESSAHWARSDPSSAFRSSCASTTHSPLLILSKEVTFDEVQVLKNPSTSPLSRAKPDIGRAFIAGDDLKIGVEHFFDQDRRVLDSRTRDRAQGHLLCPSPRAAHRIW